jgi:hypothetical protein
LGATRECVQARPVFLSVRSGIVATPLSPR